MNIPLLAGTVSTVLFAASMLPMLLKAVRTKDLESYSVGNIATTNVANAVHSFYVFDLPAGPVWLLHSFYIVASALMLLWCLRYRKVPDDALNEPIGEPVTEGTEQ
ncbi:MULTISPECIES: hypothetical protein [Micrococcaceae]|jgi:uncharacterized protein with PQ loop repeat|uniref:Uncharacterized protein n=1 Tax=Paenarthrobacter aurescens (strain TC1) TaxID=290340 RepID=A1R8L8_PAEAT|nr:MULTISPECIES: hypothetical protein [Micrococcaceae]ABM08134.1 conserved hypothetical protein [Paenarthrobacter aurescens TC1]AFR29909.1 hypothetical protein ARUE_c30240 [Arthrobacter sp. Rue61a]MBP2265021.1 uncharacterized protein with PQ loop repeat [Pseudarthrobacter sp. PvP004]